MPSKKSRLAALARLQNAKETGESQADGFISDEEEFGPAGVDDFAGDDNFVVGEGLGYEETGRDLYALDDEDRRAHNLRERKRKQKKKKREQKKRKKASQKKNYFATKKSKAETAAVKICHTKEQTEEFMNNLLEDSDEENEVEMEEPTQEPLTFVTQPLPQNTNEETMEVEEEEEEEVVPKLQVKKPKPFVAPPVAKPVVAEPPKRVQPPKRREPSPKRRKLVQSTSPRKCENTMTYTGDEDWQYFYFLDAYEDEYNNPGTVFLFGKRAILGTKRTESCVVVVKGVNRRLYVLPKETIDGSGRMDFDEVKEEINELAEKAKVTIKIWPKPMPKKYCFQARPHVPQEADYVHVRYPFNQRLLQRVEEDKMTFERVFGLRSSAKEIIVLECGLNGPGWMKIKAKPNEGAKCSWCKSEFIIQNGDSAVRMIKTISQTDEYATAPPLKVMTLAIQTTKTKKRTDELVCISTAIHDEVFLDGETDTSKKTFMNYVCPLKGKPFPDGFNDAVRSRGETKKFSSEKVMLNAFTAYIQKEDPDVIAGHSIINFGMEVLMTRMRVLGISMWSKIGRRKKTGRNSIPRKRFIQRGACAGRLLCDTFTSAQEFLFGEKNYSFSALCESQLGQKHQNIDVHKIPDLWSNPKDLLETVTHCCQDALLVLELMFKLEVLPLTKQLTCLCGNVWQESLMSQRALRNEYLLLHEFHKNGFIVPEKFTKQEKIDMGIIKDDGKKGRRRKKAEYSGGLVLDPKVGFYNTYILCLDFNSLYPSIIQEYNLCFSTMQHWLGLPNDRQVQKMFEDMPLNPEKGDGQALLPEIITMLLTARGQYKKEMKAAQKAGRPFKKLDIKQRAYKLVANSMYGCLGFTNSRFFCMPIAAMITALGRKNLQKAANFAVAEVPQVEVVYGDTDSIMVNTQLKSDGKHTHIKQAKQIAHKIKNRLNKTYTKMYLDLDDVFAKFLISKKKKYAALKVNEVEGKLETKLEFKGLDLVRRDWAQISSTMGKHCLKIIMGTEDDEECAIRLKEYLSQRCEAMKEGKVPLESYQVTKKLTKDVTDYKEGTHLAHVECAKKMREAGIPANVGDFIQYIIVEGEGQDYARAYHIQQVREKSMKIDMDYYLKKQIIPPICRLIEPLDTINGPMVGECFGVEVKLGSHRSTGGGRNFDGDALAPLDQEQDEEIQFENEEEKFAECDPLKITCRYCKMDLRYEGVLHPKTFKVGFKCILTKNCPGYVTEENREQDLAFYKNQIRNQFNAVVRQYYKRTFKCVGMLNPAVCPFQNRRHSIPLGASRHCVCGGTVTESFSALKLNRQLDYFIYLFDVAKAESRHAQKNEDAKVQNPKTVKQLYQEVNVDLKYIHELKKYVRIFKRGSAYARLATKSICEAYVPKV